MSENRLVHHGPTEVSRQKLRAEWGWIVLTLVGMIFCFPETLIGQNVVVQQPTFGVSIDAKGVLTAKAFPGGPALIATRMAAAKARLGADLLGPSDMRFVSLRRLDQAIQQRLSDGKQPTEEMLKLAGLLRIEYVFALPDQNDILIGGPAEGWIESPAGHIVGIESGLPTLFLQDLTTALQVFDKGRPINQWIGVSIGPTGNAIAKLQQFNKTIPRSIPSGQEQFYARTILEETIKCLGMAGVSTFGIDPATHMAKRLIEADYRMKLIGIGAEPPPLPMKTFYNQIKSPPPEILQRWWFVPDYKRVQIPADRLSLHLVGAGIQLMTENYDRDRKTGGLKASKRKPSGASRAYTESFNRNFEKIARLSSAFGQMRSATDLLVAAAFLRQEKIYEKTSWEPEWVSDKRIQYEPHVAIRQTPCLINSKWNGRRFFTLAGGGVSITPYKALKKENVLPLDPKKFEIRPAKIPADDWWWDAP